ncbi:MAG TPA: 1-(5-phosphoribosyl)-5-[(5-phosphoribosylamino)methylideneamino]imidazole-4-carboxamide isomerase [Phototrophicaceae bacterium]|jgi:phosphoribosylformimino-5-aminoimidazole carboxamide ribotide isomerase|nr:1-(5-phosphoribosyl)-5-[(5-phosphoribosylamino)methylideneamino]imidazole-4-carboxamide isomerase [Phototrophicaceae bacterium]
MIIYPAIDLRGGKVVRLKEGNPDHQTIFSDDPFQTAKQWIDQGATWLHIVNLDGAFAEANDNGTILEKIAGLNVHIQSGGGLRSMTDIERAFERGIERVVLGTVAVEKPEIVPTMIEKFGADRICIALDARDGKVATHGWQQASELTPVEFGRRMAAVGVKHALYTDVHRDGSLIGVNIHDTILLGRETGLGVIASGGISHADEIHQLARSGVVAGAVIGMALYEGYLTLVEALMAARNGMSDAG